MFCGNLWPHLQITKHPFPKVNLNFKFFFSFGYLLSAGNHAAFAQLMMKVIYSNADNLEEHMVQDVSTLYVRLRKELQMSRTVKKIAPIVSWIFFEIKFVFQNRFAERLTSKANKIIREAVLAHGLGYIDDGELQTIKESFDTNVNNELDSRRGNSSVNKYHRWKHQRGTYQSVDASVHRRRKTT